MANSSILEEKEYIQELGPIDTSDWGKRFTKGHIFTHCARGHEFSQENTYLTPKGNKVCITCRNVRAKFYQRKRYRENPEKFAKQRNDYALWHKYGITSEQKEEMLQNQNYRCANKKCLADKPNAARSSTTWLVDHDHKTGKVRGLLCNTCNLTLGAFNDSVEKLEGLVEYLKEHQSGQQ